MEQTSEWEHGVETPLALYHPPTTTTTCPSHKKNFSPYHHPSLME